jgi:outer membrane lipoprotein-sorting protein
MRRKSRGLRRQWAVPAIAAAAVVGITVLPDALSAGADTPQLPPLTPVELVTKAEAANVTALSGTVRVDAHLGLPDLGSLGGLTSSNPLVDFLSGSHEVDVWLGDTDHQRVALAAPLAETDWIRNGDDLWSWDSTTQRVVHATLGDRTSDHADADAPTDVGQDATPAAAAQRLLDSIDPSTVVEVRTPRTVAGRPAYELAISPRSPASTIGEAAISIDAETGVPLDVQVTARGATSPALEIGFTSVSFATPDPSNFTFTPPPGSTTVETTDPAQLLTPGGTRHDGEDGRPGPVPMPDANAAATDSGGHRSVMTVGEDWDTVAVVAGVDLPNAVRRFVDSGTPVSVGSVTGHLVSTPLVNALVLDDGRIAVGAVTVDALEAAVAGGG